MSEELYFKLRKIFVDQLDITLKKEWNDYNEFLNDNNISVLPDGHYIGAKKLDYKEIRELRDKWDKL